MLLQFLAPDGVMTERSGSVRAALGLSRDLGQGHVIEYQGDHRRSIRSRWFTPEFSILHGFGAGKPIQNDLCDSVTDLV